MKRILSLYALAALTTAFPAQLLQELQNDPSVAARYEDILGKRQVSADGATAIFEANPTFDEQKQLIDVGPGSGHEWQAPGPNDVRGVCPGLNAFANHGFLPRNGMRSDLSYLRDTG